MDSNNWLYLKLNKFLLKCFGLWPYQSKFSKHCNYLIFLAWTSFIVLPLAQGLPNTTDDVVFYGTIMGIAFVLGSILVGSNLYLRSHWLARLIEKIESDLRAITDLEELAIMEKFSRQARNLNLIHMGGGIIYAIFFVLMNYVPIVYANDKDYSKVFSNYAKNYVIHEDFRRHQMIIHISLATFHGAFLYIATTGMYTCGVQHTCGIYAIVSYRLQKLVGNRGVLKHEKPNDKNQIMRALMKIVIMHREAIRSTHIVRRTFSRTFYVLQIGALICIAIVLSGIRLGAHTSSTLLTFKGITLTTVFIAHIFYLNYGGEQIIKHSNEVFLTTYFMKWYLLSTDERKILLMIILRSSKFDRLSAGGMTLSLQDFTTVMKFSWSLAAVLLSKLESVSVPLD